MQPLHPHPPTCKMRANRAVVAASSRAARGSSGPCSNRRTPDPATRAAAEKLFQAMC